MVLYELSPRFQQAKMPEDLYLSVRFYLRLQHPTLLLHSWVLPAEALPLIPEALFFDYVGLSGRRHWASARNKNIANALVAVRKVSGGYAVAELMAILGIAQSGLPIQRFGYVSWPVSQLVAVPGTCAWNSRYNFTIKLCLYTLNLT